MESTVQTSHDSEVRIRDTGVASEGRAEQGERSVNLKEFHRVSLTDGITLYVAPRRIEQWDNFVGRYPEKSIALDGFVYGKPRFEPEGAYLNSNHHEEVDRLSTRSTSAQIFIAIKQGLINTYTVDGAVRMNIFVNDPDQDTCLAVWLLKNHERILGQRSEPLINRLVELEDRFDPLRSRARPSLQAIPRSSSRTVFTRLTESQHCGRSSGSTRGSLPMRSSMLEG